MKYTRMKESQAFIIRKLIFTISFIITSLAHGFLDDGIAYLSPTLFSYHQTSPSLQTGWCSRTLHLP